MPRSTEIIEIRSWIDRQSMSVFQWRVLILCFLIVAIDGFDTACVGFIAPALARQWALSPSTLGSVFAAGLLGLMGGALCFGSLADKIGRRKTLIGSVAFFGLASSAAAFSPTVSVLIVLRFVTGLGLGAAMPNAIALTSEYCPERKRAFLTTLMFCGFTLGSGFGGLVSAALIPEYGWNGVLLFGGLMPLALVPILLVGLPESVRYLALRKADTGVIASLLKRIAPLTAQGDVAFELHEPAKVGSPVRQLFAPEFRVGTLLIWTVFFMSLLVVYLMTNWLPTFIHRSGLPLSTASRFAVLYQVGGTVGALVIGRLMDLRSPTSVLTVMYALGAAFLVATGLTSGFFLAMSIAGVGFCISGSQIGANTYAARFYPTVNRVTGISWALGVGRFGSVVGAMIGGQLLIANLPFPVLFSLAAMPALIASAAIAACGRHAKFFSERDVAVRISDASGA
ncbi:MFS transporter [Burkholderia multivorans]|uniref:MFS transporter n=1 Tax=Burkholderia multivorans TaxID=87883 RepID=UPI00158D3F83|nr:MFS transporter [Burkholderia multivorans]